MKQNSLSPRQSSDTYKAENTFRFISNSNILLKSQHKYKCQPLTSAHIFFSGAHNSRAFRKTTRIQLLL